VITQLVLWYAALPMLAAAAVLAIVRLLRGPSLPDLELRENQVIRIYDIIFDYENLLGTDKFFRTLCRGEAFQHTFGTAEFHNLVGKYATKASNGFWHSFYFTTGRFPDPLRANARNHRIAEASCRHCHSEITAAIEHGAERPMVRQAAANDVARPEEFSCIRCHRYVGHWVR